MSQNAKTVGGGTRMKKFNYTKWGLIIAIAGVIVTALTVPELRSVIGLQSETPKSASPVVSKAVVELITQTETGEALDGVRIQFISQGAPEVQYTDNNGYAKVQIPSQGDVVVNLSKKGYPPQNFMINLENDQTRTRIVRFTQSGVPNVQPIASASPLPSPSSLPSSLTLPPQNSSQENSVSKLTFKNEEFQFELKKCQRKQGIVTCDFFWKNLASKNRTVSLGNGSSIRSRCFDFSGNEYFPQEVQLGKSQGQEASISLIPGIAVKASLRFELPQDITKLAVLEVKYDNVSGGQFQSAEFRNVDIVVSN
jgi:hypothetical protein